MRRRGATGLWEIFLPGVAAGAVYKYHIRSRTGAVGSKADPYGFSMEKRPETASVFMCFEWQRGQMGSGGWM